MFKTVKINNEVVSISKDPNRFNLNQLTERTFENFKDYYLEETILDIVKNNRWKVIFSRQEYFLIKTPKPFMLSGQPGTGKTTVILVKIFANYFNLQMKKSLLKNNEIDWEYIKGNMNKKNVDNQFRLVFTSLSQKLCDKTQESYEKMINKSELEVDFEPLTEERLRQIHSFEDVKSYPLFANFRKLLFMLDGSLTFQFFYRVNHTRFNPAKNDCDVNFMRGLSYVCNDYYMSKNDFDCSTYFLRSPSLTSEEKRNQIEINEYEFHLFYQGLIDKGKEYFINFMVF